MSQKKIKSKMPFSNIGLGKDRDYFIENLSLLVGSGMPITSVLDSIATEVVSRRMKSVLVSIREEVENGSPLWRALQKSGLFKEHTMSLIRLGEESGKLVQNLKVVEIEEEKERIFRSRLRSAMMYPVFVLGLTIIVGTGIAWFILPKLALVFGQLKLKLPLATEILISTGTFLDHYGMYVVPGVIIFIVALFYFLFFAPKTKAAGQALYYYVPGVKQLVKEVEIARFGYHLGTLLQAGLPITKALQSLASATESVRYRQLYEHLSTSVEDGNSFAKSFASFGRTDRLIPSPIQQLIVAGEQSGSLAETFLKVGQTFEAKADIATKNLTIILEPILLVIVWLGVVAVALAIILPIYRLVGSLNT